MGLIETIRRRRSVGIAIVVALFSMATAVVLLGWSSGVAANHTKAYYSDDDGKTFFVDDVSRAYPFDHGGSRAYRAYVFKGDNGISAVVYLERYTAKGLARKQELAAQPVTDGGAEAAALFLAQTEVKKPGESHWVPRSSPRFNSVILPADPTARCVSP